MNPFLSPHECFFKISHPQPHIFQIGKIWRDNINSKKVRQLLTSKLTLKNQFNCLLKQWTEFQIHSNLRWEL